MPPQKRGPRPSRIEQTIRAAPDTPLYRQFLRTSRSENLPDTLLIRGLPPIPRGPRLGLVCCRRMKGTLIIAMYDYAKSLIAADGVVVGGFHSPMEKQVLELLLARHVPVIVVPARNPESMRIPQEWTAPMEEGRLTIVSGVGGRTRRPTRELALKRNLLVVALSDRVLIPYATRGGGAEQVARAVVESGKPLWTFKDEDNERLFEAGALPAPGRPGAIAFFDSSH